MSLTRTVAHNTAVQLIGKVMSTMLGLVAVALMMRSLGTEQFGWYITAAAFLQFFGLVSDFGFTLTTSNLLSEPDADEKKIMDTAFTWRLITALVFNSAAPVAILFFPYPAPVKQAVVLLSVSFFAIALSQVFLGHFRARLKIFTATMSEVVARVVLVAGVVLAAGGQNIFLPMMTAVTIASIAGLMYLWIFYGRVHLSLDRTISKKFFVKTWPTALAIIFNAFYLQGDRVILPLYADAASVGLYGAAWRVLEVVIQFAAVVMGITMPLVTYAWSRNLWNEFKQRYQLSFDMLALLLLPMLAGTYVLATPLIEFVAGREFAAAGPMLRNLSWVIAAICFGLVFGHIMLAINRQRAALLVFASDAVLSLIGYLVFIPRFGVTGAIGVTLFSEFYAGIGLALLTIYYAKTRPCFTAFLKIALASLGMGLALYLLPPLPVLVSIAIGIVVYGLLVLLLKAVSPATIREVLTFRKEVVAEKAGV